MNFQTPTEAVYRAFTALLGVPLDPGGGLRDCAIVSTFSTREVRALSFRDFTAYGAHGIAGPTAFATPALPGPVYFNERVLPDPTQRQSSIDGGVVWTGVPAGVYTLYARHPSTRFVTFTATCRPGRVVNANPPWGLHELGKAMPAAVSARWTVGATSLRLRSLRVAKLPPASLCGSAARARVARSGGEPRPAREPGASTCSARSETPAVGFGPARAWRSS